MTDLNLSATGEAVRENGAAVGYKHLVQNGLSVEKFVSMNAIPVRPPNKTCVRQTPAT